MRGAVFCLDDFVCGLGLLSGTMRAEPCVEIALLGKECAWDTLQLCVLAMRAVVSEMRPVGLLSSTLSMARLN